jgi:hypothetical protein
MQTPYRSPVIRILPLEAAPDPFAEPLIADEEAVFFWRLRHAHERLVINAVGATLTTLSIMISLLLLSR